MGHALNNLSFLSVRETKRWKVHIFRNFPYLCFTSWLIPWKQTGPKWSSTWKPPLENKASLWSFMYQICIGLYLPILVH
ncbi:hypothetical protein MtrunA17_Chr1g0175491 [Medicago truncatula]|uniref:Transmembrane protein n=1 Tax=Medicago truncatula TaxID=3880 RepID=A0A396JRA6_MEDTR|nr:hypothetical protein MtrunA17_Chr1g0175491 [Medicago truncatula]